MRAFSSPILEALYLGTLRIQSVNDYSRLVSLRTSRFGANARRRADHRPRTTAQAAEVLEVQSLGEGSGDRLGRGVDALSDALLSEALGRRGVELRPHLLHA